MTNFRLKNLFVVLFVLISLFIIYGCSSKPPEEKMKSIIIAIIESKAAPYESNLNIEKLKVTNGFNKKINDEKWYCIEASFTMTFDSVNMETHGKDKKIVEVNQSRFSFVKRGNDWYGQKGWVE